MKKAKKKSVKKANERKSSSIKAKYKKSSARAVKAVAKKARPKAKSVVAGRTLKVRPAESDKNTILIETVEILETPLNPDGPFVSELEEDAEEEMLTYSGLENEVEIREEAYDYLKGADSNSVDCE